MRRTASLISPPVRREAVATGSPRLRCVALHCEPDVPARVFGRSVLVTTEVQTEPCQVTRLQRRHDCYDLPAIFAEHHDASHRVPSFLPPRSSQGLPLTAGAPERIHSPGNRLERPRS